MIEALVILISIGIMVAALFLILIPAVPVSALEWALVMVFAALNYWLLGSVFGTMRITLPAGILVTVFGLLGSTSSLWMPLFGFRGRDVSCPGLLAFFGGMILGSFLIPIPFIGTIIGGVVGIMLLEYARVRELRRSFASGQLALKTILLGMAAELAFAVAIVVTFLVSIATTA